MSTIILLTPVIIGGWPSIVAAVGGAAAALGLSVGQMGYEEAKDAIKESERALMTNVEVQLADSRVVAQGMGSQKELIATRGSVELRIRRDESGRCVVCASGKDKTKVELTEMAEAFAAKVTQVYVYNKIMNELHSKGMKIANEEAAKDGSIRINVRNEEA